MRRSLRLAAVAAALALVATSAQPARAITWRQFVVRGQAQLSGPLGYPFLNGIPQVPPSTSGHPNCLPPLPTLPGQPTLTLGNVWDTVPLTNCHLHWGGNTRTITGFFTSTCVNLGLNVTKTDKAPAHTGACTVTLVGHPLNTVSGFCGLSGGQLVVTITDALGQTFTADIHFTTLSALVLSGHWTKVGSTQRGLVLGLAQAIPQLPPPIGSGESCTNKTATTFDITAVAWFLPM